VAHAPDGVAEAAEIPAHPFAVAVQWHGRAGRSGRRRASLFRALVEAAHRRSRGLVPQDELIRAPPFRRTGRRTRSSEEVTGPLPDPKPVTLAQET
jgi:hypothetical protein